MLRCSLVSNHNLTVIIFLKALMKTHFNNSSAYTILRANRAKVFGYSNKSRSPIFNEITGSRRTKSAVNLLFTYLKFKFLSFCISFVVVFFLFNAIKWNC